MDIQLVMQGWDALKSEEAKKNLKKELAIYLNDLLLHNFDKLVQLLYQIDVPEKNVRKVLVENEERDAGELIAELLIKRQEEKIAMRQSFPPANDISEDERW
ncbi:MAG: hypothetical protein EOO10_09265 [Chitinophagaceae bacterium]|nr:MAG: hypothetical protein EOO10_09265 [Chitinophagaceae bacterium]